MSERQAAYAAPDGGPTRIGRAPRNRCVVCGAVRPADLACCLSCVLEHQVTAGDTVPKPQRETRFHQTRRWRWDLCWPAAMLAVEVDGGTFMAGGGRHNRGAGYQADLDKLNAAAILGWVVLRFSRKDVESGRAAEMVRSALERQP